MNHPLLQRVKQWYNAAGRHTTNDVQRNFTAVHQKTVQSMVQALYFRISGQERKFVHLSLGQGYPRRPDGRRTTPSVSLPGFPQGSPKIPKFYGCWEGAMEFWDFLYSRGLVGSAVMDRISSAKHPCLGPLHRMHGGKREVSKRGEVPAGVQEAAAEKPGDMYSFSHGCSRAPTITKPSEKKCCWNYRTLCEHSHDPKRLLSADKDKHPTLKKIYLKKPIHDPPTNPHPLTPKPP